MGYVYYQIKYNIVCIWNTYSRTRVSRSDKEVDIYVGRPATKWVDDIVLIGLVQDRNECHNGWLLAVCEVGLLIMIINVKPMEFMFFVVNSTFRERVDVKEILILNLRKRRAGTSGTKMEREVTNVDIHIL